LRRSIASQIRINVALPIMPLDQAANTRPTEIVFLKVLTWIESGTVECRNALERNLDHEAAGH